LPQPRSDATAATIGPTTYIVGGYTGSQPDPAVLATRNGRTFRSVASLSVPVRYPAVAALDGKLFVFGGEAVSGAHPGHPVDDIQVVDPATGSASVVGHLPEPLESAAAATLDGHVYLAGGDTSASPMTRPGVGTTQLSPAPSPRQSGLTTVSTIWCFDAARARMLVAGHLQVPVSNAGVAVVGSRAWLVGGETGGTQLAVVQMITPNPSFGHAGAVGAGSPYFGGRLLVADRANNRLLLLSPAMRILWRFPSPAHPPDRHGFYFPDDSFFVRHGTAIISNQEQNETVQVISFPSGKVSWAYGHKLQAGSAPGFLHEPDDAYLLKSGLITVADAQNCRVLVLRPNHTVAHQIGTTGSCVHAPPHSMGSPNGDTPLADGNLLVSEINGSRVSEYTQSGRLIWSRALPISYPSDPQQLGGDRYLIADYATPGQILEFNRAGKVLYRYDVAGGPGMLDHPSLVERLPSGVFMVNDDYRDRMVAIDPVTRALVWQYGLTNHPGTSAGQLRVPDGFDLLMADGSTPTHPQTG
jgi:outer membrane protein assembly factor BamB